MWPFFSVSIHAKVSVTDVRKLRNDSLLSEFSSHVVLGSKKFKVKFALSEVQKYHPWPFGVVLILKLKILNTKKYLPSDGHNSLGSAQSWMCNTESEADE